jgi:putative transposase
MATSPLRMTKLKHVPRYRRQTEAGRTKIGQRFFQWYNEEHRHSGVGLLTPAMVHYGQTENILRQHQEVLNVAYQRHPERFVRSAPRPPALHSEVWINKPSPVAGDASS